MPDRGICTATYPQLSTAYHHRGQHAHPNRGASRPCETSSSPVGCPLSTLNPSQVPPFCRTPPLRAEQPSSRHHVGRRSPRQANPTMPASSRHRPQLWSSSLSTRAIIFNFLSHFTSTSQGPNPLLPGDGWKLRVAARLHPLSKDDQWLRCLFYGGSTSVIHVQK